MSLRRAVLDASVVAAAHLPTKVPLGGQAFDPTRRAREVLRAVEGPHVRVYAPDILLSEYLTVAHRAMHPRVGQPLVSTEQAQHVVDEFLSLRFTYLPSLELVEDAWRVATHRRTSVADAWYIACALRVGHGCELWFTHEHADGTADAARAEGVDVRLLTHDRF